MKFIEISQKKLTVSCVQ